MRATTKGSDNPHKSIHVLATGFAFEKVITGGDQLFFDIAPRLPKDLKITVITPYFTEPYWDGIDKSNIEFRFLPRNRFDLKTNPVMIFLSYSVRAWQTYRILQKEDVQTLYSCSDVSYADIWPAFWLKKRRPNVKWLSRIYHVLLPPKNRQGNFFVNVVAFRLQRLSFWMMKKRSDTVFALNPKLYDEVAELGFPKEQLAVLGAGIDFKAINSFKPDKEYPYHVVALGRIAPVKGIFDTVKAWKKVHEAHPELQLAWIGGGSDNHRKKLAEQLKENSLTSSFHLLGFIDKDEVYSILKSAKVFLCPDHENGWGLAVCEAMSSGLPVVSYNLDIFGNVYQKGYKSVPLFDTESFANEIIGLIENEKERQRIAKDAVAQAKEFDHQHIIDDLLKYI